MLHKFRKLVLALVLFMLAPAVLAAQSPQSFNWDMAVSIDPFLSCAVSQNINFGNHFSSVGWVTTDPANFALIDCTTDLGNAMSVTFSALPTVMDGPGGATIPIVYGVESVWLQDLGVFSVKFDPAIGVVAFPVTTGNARMSLGEGNGLGAISVDLTGAAIGAYTAIITVDISIS